MNRECNKCVFHASGSCSAWECKGTKTVEDVKRETRKEVYRKGFMDGVNDQAERYKNSVYRQKHDTELLDKVAEKFCGRIRLRELTRAETMDIFDEVIAEMKAEVSNE